MELPGTLFFTTTNDVLMPVFISTTSTLAKTHSYAVHGPILNRRAVCKMFHLTRQLEDSLQRSLVPREFHGQRYPRRFVDLDSLRGRRLGESQSRGPTPIDHQSVNARRAMGRDWVRGEYISLSPPNMSYCFFAPPPHTADHQTSLATPRSNP